jgi:hypothetical protein
MTLPNDISRCIGHNVEAFARTCAQRDTCRRYLEVTPGGTYWYVHPQIPGPCIYHLPPLPNAPPAEGPGGASPKGPNPLQFPTPNPLERP